MCTPPLDNSASNVYTPLHKSASNVYTPTSQKCVQCVHPHLTTVGCGMNAPPLPKQARGTSTRSTSTPAAAPSGINLRPQGEHCGGLFSSNCSACCACIFCACQLCRACLHSALSYRACILHCAHLACMFPVLACFLCLYVPCACIPAPIRS